MDFPAIEFITIISMLNEQAIGVMSIVMNVTLTNVSSVQHPKEPFYNGG